MRSLLIFTAFAISVVSSRPAWSDPVTIRCSACRSVYTYPKDYGNYAFNQVLGDHPTLSLSEGSRVKVVNLQGEWGVVDLAFILEGTGLSLSILVLSYSLTIPDGTIQIRVQDPEGTMTSYQVFSDSPDLRVGDGTQTSTPTEPAPETEDPYVSTTLKSPGGLDLLGGYDASANYYGGATYPYYDLMLMNE